MTRQIAPSPGHRDVPGFRTRPEPNTPAPAPPLVESDAGGVTITWPKRRAKRRRKPSTATR